MKKWTLRELKAQGYEVENCIITDVSLNMESHACFTLNLGIEGNGWGCVYGGYCLGNGYLGADDSFWKGSEKGLESIMRVMDTVGVSELTDLKGKHIRVASKGFGSSVKIIGNIIKDKWFDYESFFDDRGTNE